MTERNPGREPWSIAGMARAVVLQRGPMSPESLR